MFFECESMKEPTEAFHEAVDDYLAYSQDEGIEPDNSYTGLLNVSLTPAIHRQIAMLTLQSGLSINAYIKNALEENVVSAVAINHFSHQQLLNKCGQPLPIRTNRVYIKSARTMPVC